MIVIYRSCHCICLPYCFMSCTQRVTRYSKSSPGGYSCVCPYLATDRRACQHLHLCPRLIRGWRLHLHHRLICGWRLRLPLPWPPSGVAAPLYSDSWSAPPPASVHILVGVDAHEHQWRVMQPSRVCYDIDQEVIAEAPCVTTTNGMFETPFQPFFLI
jgi:hypothetical protein